MRGGETPQRVVSAGRAFLESHWRVGADSAPRGHCSPGLRGLGPFGPRTTREKTWPERCRGPGAGSLWPTWGAVTARSRRPEFFCPVRSLRLGAGGEGAGNGGGVARAPRRSGRCLGGKGLLWPSSDVQETFSVPQERIGLPLACAPQTPRPERSPDKGGAATGIWSLGTSPFSPGPRLLLRVPSPSQGRAPVEQLHWRLLCRGSACGAPGSPRAEVVRRPAGLESPTALVGSGRRGAHGLVLFLCVVCHWAVGAVREQ